MFGASTFLQKKHQSQCILLGFHQIVVMRTLCKAALRLGSFPPANHCEFHISVKITYRNGERRIWKICKNEDSYKIKMQGDFIKQTWFRGLIWWHFARWPKNHWWIESAFVMRFSHIKPWSRHHTKLRLSIRFLKRKRYLLDI